MPVGMKKLIKLGKLEDYAVRFDSNEKGSDKWLDNLVAPGSSLGGARPKAGGLIILNGEKRIENNR